jgi:hypothetical protein
VNLVWRLGSEQFAWWQAGVRQLFDLHSTAVCVAVPPRHRRTSQMAASAVAHPGSQSPCAPQVALTCHGEM